METRARKFFDERIDILGVKVADASPARQVFKTVRAILALTRVSVLVSVPPIDTGSSSVDQPGRDD